MVKIQWSFNKCSRNIKNEFRDYWKQKQNRIERLLSSRPSSARKIRITVYNHSNRVKQYEARAVMEVPGRSLAVQCSGMMANTVVDKLADSIAAAIRKYKDLFRHSYRQQRKERNIADLADALPMLIEDEKNERKKSFFELLRPLLKFLVEQARRELKILEFEGVLRPDYISPEELVDEVVIRAWECFSLKPDEKSMEHWLTGLLYDVLQNVEREPSQFVSLDESIRNHDIDSIAEPDWKAGTMDYDENLTLAELVPDDEQSEAWGDLSDESQRVHIYTVLQNLPTVSRQAYLLYSVEEYTVEEIAQIQNRSPKDVRLDINQGREAMHSYLLDSGMID